MSKRETTKLTLENEWGTYTVEMAKTEVNLDEMFSLFVLPVLFAAGYGPESVRDWINEGDD